MSKSSNKVVLLWLLHHRKRLEMRMMTTCVEDNWLLCFRGSRQQEKKTPKSCRKKKNEWPVPTSSSDPHNNLPKKLQMTCLWKIAVKGQNLFPLLEKKPVFIRNLFEFSTNFYFQTIFIYFIQLFIYKFVYNFMSGEMKF